MTAVAECRRCGRPRSGSAHCRWCGELARSTRCRLHARRVAARACAVCGAALCRDCLDGSRRVALCRGHADVSFVAGWAELLRTSGELEAELTSGILRAAGIEARVLSQKDHANVVTFGGLSVVRILVPPFELEAARRLLEEGPDPTG